MTSEKLYVLLQAFTDYYWSVPVSYAINKITEWHPEVTVQQVTRALRRDKILKYHFYVESEGLDEPEIVAEHLVAIDYNDFVRFLSARFDLPYRDCDEQTLLKYDDEYLDIPEKQAIIEFGRDELGLDDEWAMQLVNDCVLSQPIALCEGESWVKSVLTVESYGRIHFRNVTVQSTPNNALTASPRKAATMASKEETP